MTSRNYSEKAYKTFAISNDTLSETNVKIFKTTLEMRNVCKLINNVQICWKSKYTKKLSNSFGLFAISPNYPVARNICRIVWDRSNDL